MKELKTMDGKIELFKNPNGTSSRIGSGINLSEKIRNENEEKKLWDAMGLYEGYMGNLGIRREKFFLAVEKFIHPLKKGQYNLERHNKFFSETIDKVKQNLTNLELLLQEFKEKLTNYKERLQSLSSTIQAAVSSSEMKNTVHGTYINYSVKNCAKCIENLDTCTNNIETCQKAISEEDYRSLFQEENTSSISQLLNIGKRRYQSNITWYYQIKAFDLEKEIKEMIEKRLQSAKTARLEH